MPYLPHNFRRVLFAGLLILFAFALILVSQMFALPNHYTAARATALLTWAANDQAKAGIATQFMNCAEGPHIDPRVLVTVEGCISSLPTGYQQNVRELTKAAEAAVDARHPAPLRWMI